MNFGFTVLETSLNRAEFRWKFLGVLQHTARLGIVGCVSLLLWGAAIHDGWVVNKTLALGILALLAVFGFVAWAVITISVLAGSPPRERLAAAVERIDPRLMDRLNTLLFLEKRRGEPRAESFALRIARQTQGVLADKPSPSPFSASRSLVWLLALVATASLTLFLNWAYSPWHQLLAAEKAGKSVPASPEKPLELALPNANNVEQNQAWGEVRITDPGADLKVTKVDVVPLQIEAAANQPLKQVQWLSTINGTEEVSHDLPAPSEPRYAAYQPTIYLDEFQLSDWDVLTYYARATTEKEGSFGSEVYFLEVRPFREDILKMPGGEGGKAYGSLNEFSTLINRQRHVIRQTHQHLQRPLAQENLQTQDRKKLSEAEDDLSDSTKHLYAKLAAEMENKPIGDALDNLGKAETSLGRASSLLQDNVMGEAQNRERSALAELVAARKMFHKAVTDNPKAFDGDSDSQSDSENEPAPVTDSSKKLNQMAEFRDEAKAAQDFVQKALDDQKSLEQQARTAARSEYPKLAEEEQRLSKSLEDFQGQHPNVFKGTETAAGQAQEAMARAADALQQKSNEAGTAAQQATRQLENFSQAMQHQSAGQQLANAYKLKQMLDQQIKKLDQAAKPDSTIPDADVQKTAEEARKTVSQLRDAAEQEPTRDAFGQPLRDALSGTNKVELDSKLLQLQQAQDQTAKQQQAGEAKQGLGKVSQAFEASQPKSLQMARQTDSLKPGEQDGFGQGMAELDSLTKQLENNRPISPADQAKQAQQALANLRNGMRSQFGDSERGKQILGQLEQMLKAQKPLDPGSLKKLMDELQHFSVETSEKLTKQEDHPEVTNIDPSRLPPAYRGRIQRYFEKLSEK